MRSIEITASRCAASAAQTVCRDWLEIGSGHEVR
jgi:hypothetical protein